MQAVYSVGYGKPPVHTRFQKGRSGNPGPRKTRRLRFAQMLDAAMSESMETVETTPCKTLRATMARDMALDAVGGKTATFRLIFSLFDQLDAAEAMPKRGIRGLDDMLEQAEALDAANGAGCLSEGNSQGVIEEEPPVLWRGFAHEPPRSQAPAEPPQASRNVTPADASAPHTNFPSQGNNEGRKTEGPGSERHLLAVASMKPGKDDIRRLECEKAVERKRWSTKGRPLAAALLSSAGDVSPPNIGMRNPAPLPDFSIRPRAQAAAA